MPALELLHSLSRCWVLDVLASVHVHLPSVVATLWPLSGPSADTLCPSAGSKSEVMLFCCQHLNQTAQLLLLRAARTDTRPRCKQIRLAGPCIQPGSPIQACIYPPVFRGRCDDKSTHRDCNTRQDMLVGIPWHKQARACAPLRNSAKQLLPNF